MYFRISVLVTVPKNFLA